MASVRYVVQLGRELAGQPAMSGRRQKMRARRRSTSPANIELGIDILTARARLRTRSATRFTSRPGSSATGDPAARRHRRRNAGGDHRRRRRHRGDRNGRRWRRRNPGRVADTAGIVDRIIQTAGAAHAFDAADPGILSRGYRRRQADCQDQGQKCRSADHEYAPTRVY